MLFNPMEPNGFTMYVMQSDEYKQKIVDTATSFMEDGWDAENAVELAMKFLHIGYCDLTDTDQEYIENFIKENE